MKSNRIITLIAGVLIFLSIAVTFSWFLSSSKDKELKELALDEVVTKIDNREIRETAFKQSRAEVTNIKGEKFFTNLGSDPTRESLIGKINKYNEVNTSAPIKYSEEQASSGWGWIVLINSLQMFLFFFMWAATLAVIVYAVKTLARNKSS